MSTFTNYLIVILIALIILLTFTYSSDYLQMNIPFIQNFESSEHYENYENNEKMVEKTNTKINNLNNLNNSNNLNKVNIDNRVDRIDRIDKTDDINNFLIDTNFGTIDSDNLNRDIFLQTEEYQMTENTNNAIFNALQNI
jgi:hypothetical protein